MVPRVLVIVCCRVWFVGFLFSTLSLTCCLPCHLYRFLFSLFGVSLLPMVAYLVFFLVGVCNVFLFSSGVSLLPCLLRFTFDPPSFEIY